MSRNLRDFNPANYIKLVFVLKFFPKNKYKYMNLKKPLNSWNEYLAGLIDGDGSLLICKAGYASCEITLDIYDESVLLDIQKKLSGYVKKDQALMLIVMDYIIKQV